MTRTRRQGESVTVFGTALRQLALDADIATITPDSFLLTALIGNLGDDRLVDRFLVSGLSTFDATLKYLAYQDQILQVSAKMGRLNPGGSVSAVSPNSGATHSQRNPPVLLHQHFRPSRPGAIVADFSHTGDLVVQPALRLASNVELKDISPDCRKFKGSVNAIDTGIHLESEDAPDRGSQFVEDTYTLLYPSAELAASGQDINSVLNGQVATSTLYSQDPGDRSSLWIGCKDPISGTSIGSLLAYPYSGTACSVAGPAVMTLLSPAPELVQSNMKLFTADVSPLHVLGTILVSLHLEDRTLVNSPIHVCEGVKRFLLGIDACVDLGILPVDFPNPLPIPTPPLVQCIGSLQSPK
eukprot:maker-scaffold124_size330879-snap-gene-2.9 protein:Tk01494 transcript:maker-scaffold124_size330879-snap-gene-2.9-mRNA-1 annotation:"hypothetical protein DAPPUDRAFT_119457"